MTHLVLFELFITNTIIKIDNFCIALFSGVYKLIALTTV